MSRKQVTKITTQKTLAPTLEIPRINSNNPALLTFQEVPKDYPKDIKQYLRDTPEASKYLKMDIEDIAHQIDKVVYSIPKMSRSTAHNGVEAFDEIIKYSNESPVAFEFAPDLEYPLYMIYTWLQTFNEAEYVYIEFSPIQHPTPIRTIKNDVPTLITMETIFISKKVMTFPYILNDYLTRYPKFRPHYRSFFKLKPETNSHLITLALKTI